MFRDKEGNRLFRKVTVRVIFPDNIFPPKDMSQHAPPHQGFGPSGVDDILLGVADKLEELYPFWEFRYVELAPEGRTARYVFTFAGYRKQAIVPEKILEQLNQNPQPQSGSTLEPEIAESIPPIEAKTEIGTPLVAPLSRE